MLSERDRRAVMFLLFAVPVIVIVIYLAPRLDALFTGSSESSQKQSRLRLIDGKMRNFEKWRDELTNLQDGLHTQISTANSEEQIDGFVKAVEDVGRQAKVHISNYRQLPARVKTAAGSKRPVTRTLLIDFAATWPSLVGFVKDIEGMTMPVVIDQISLTKRTVENKPLISATLQLHLYLFPPKRAA